MIRDRRILKLWVGDSVKLRMDDGSEELGIIKVCLPKEKKVVVQYYYKEKDIDPQILDDDLNFEDNEIFLSEHYSYFQTSAINDKIFVTPRDLENSEAEISNDNFVCNREYDYVQGTWVPRGTLLSPPLPLGEQLLSESMSAMMSEFSDAAPFKGLDSVSYAAMAIGLGISVFFFVCASHIYMIASIMQYNII